MFENLSDEKLLDAYIKALELNLEDDFIALLENAMVYRGMEIPEY
ncbi:sporulation histidine kinase inhibitor Sda [Sediminibacillus massiliensis]|nr:sporulation histidine kinase inhibitor Sda [Sediminibacillus massiliensis]